MFGIPLCRKENSASVRHACALLINRLRSVPSLLTIFLALAGAQDARAVNIPPLPEIAPVIAAVHPLLVQKRDALAEERDALRSRTQQQNDSCSAVEEGSPAEKACTESLAMLTKAVETHVKETNDLLEAVAAAESSERKRLDAQEMELTEAIERDLRAVRNLGFDRRAEDFEQWERLATDARTEFQHQVSAEFTGLVASRAKDGILSGFKNLDQAKVEGWIAVLMKQDPPPTEIISVLRGMAAVIENDGVRQKLAEDAKHLSKLIEDLTKTSKVIGWTDGLPVLLDIVCDGVPNEVTAKQCKMFKAWAAFTAASLYNNAVRRVALNEIERLTSMTETQLRALDKINELLVKHIKERSAVRSKLKELG